MADYTTIDNPGLFFNTVLYTGNGSTNAITGVGYQPDWVWIKRRSGTGSNRLFDSVRGVHKSISSNSTGAELDNSNTLTSFDTDGFSLASDSGNYGVNVNGDTQVAWNWKAGGSASSNSDGSQSSTVSVNTTAGFSIVKYTGYGAATYGHGLGTTPQMIIIKKLNSSDDWFVYHHKLLTPSATQKQFILLNSTAAFASNASATTFTSVSNSTFGVGTDDKISESGDSFIAYCFAEKQGYSKFSSFIGNQSTDGTFIYTGFRPAWIMFKESSGSASGDNWFMYDNKRSTFNQTQKYLKANETDAETDNSAGAIDMLSNGFKIRTADTSLNDNGETYIYMAFAENPFVTAGTKAAGTAR